MKKLISNLCLIILSVCAVAQAQDIAIVGWGSLIWQPGELEVASDWSNDGPVLPIEFSRVSADGRLTLVIDPKTQGQGRLPINMGGNDIQTLYIQSANDDLETAIQNLRAREGCRTDMIGYVDLEHRIFRIQQVNPQTGVPQAINGTIRIVSTNPEEVDIAPGSGIRKEVLPYLKNLVAWTQQKGLSATIWTGLTNNFKEKTGRNHTIENSLQYLDGLSEGAKAKALEYIHNAPIKDKTKIGPRIN